MQIEDQIKQFIFTNLVYAQQDALDNDASFLEIGVVDSMGVMELVAFVEAQWDITVNPEELVVENFDSVRKLASFVRRKASLPREDASAPPAPSVELPLVI